MSETAYTHKNLSEVEDSAPKFGMSEHQEAHFAYGALGCEHVGFAHHRVKPGMRQAFGHKHDEAEEVYVVMAGDGRVKLDDDVVELKRLDAVRVAPNVMRQFEAGPDGLELLAFGNRCEGDGDIVPGWWSD
jgi:mannose-6-phosphate isomerase-like protein (cupin superfamily)